MNETANETTNAKFMAKISRTLRFRTRVTTPPSHAPTRRIRLIAGRTNSYTLATCETDTYQNCHIRRPECSAGKHLSCRT